jgi:hypothetical protein
MSRMLIPALAVLAIFAFSIPASAQGAKEAARLQKVAAQKLIAQADDAIDRSRKQDPKDAKIALVDLLSQVRESLDLTASQQASLVARLQARLSAVQGTAGPSRVPQDQRPQREPPPRYKAPASDPSGGVGSIAKSFQDSAKYAQTKNAELIQQRQKGRTAVDLSIERSAVLTDRDIAFAADWKEISARRKKTVGQPMTDKEVALLKTLNSTMSVNYDKDKFKSVIGHIQDKTGLSIIIDEASLRDANVDYEADTVDFKVAKVTVRTILKKVLGDKGLTYIIKEGAIQVMTPKKASEFTVVKTYQIDDLIAPSPQMQARFGPLMGQLQMQQNAQMLANMIASTIEPSYWQPNGPGVIQFYAPTRSLIIRASAEMHYQLASPGVFGGR